MTREEAIKELEDFKNESWDGMPEEVIDIAIEALKQQEIVTCKTCIHWIRGYTIPPIGKIEMHYCPMVDCSTEENYFSPDGEKKGELK